MAGHRSFAAPGIATVLIVSTIAFTVCFMVWMMFGVIGNPLKKTLGLTATEFGLLTATPLLTGSPIPVPLGIWTDKYGGRIVMPLLMGYATAYWHFLVIGPLFGLAGGSFSVGTPSVARSFPKSRQGMAMGHEPYKAPPITACQAAGGAERPVGIDGLVCFSGVAPFAYHKAPEKTAARTQP